MSDIANNEALVVKEVSCEKGSNNNNNDYKDAANNKSENEELVNDLSKDLEKVELKNDTESDIKEIDEEEEEDVAEIKEETDVKTETQQRQEVDLDNKNEKENKAIGGVDDTKKAVKPSDDKNEIIYCLKWIVFDNKQVPIILQNENGPCPLIAIANILFLKQNIKFNSKVEYITSKNLIEYLGDALFKFKPTGMNNEEEVNFNQNFSDALSSLHKLEFGLDVNVKFTGVNHFEYTRELNIFDMFNINLYHGWLVDPQQVEVSSIIQNLSYNQLVERIIHLKNSDSQVDVAQGIQVEEFLEATRSQLTYHGLIELQQALKPNELAVFFRNNHFSTIYKHNDHLYLLATDQGFLQSPSVAWETLSNIDGDIYYCNSYFRIIQNDEAVEVKRETNQASKIPHSETNDYMLAMSLQNEMDEQFANALQDEEKRRSQLEEQQYRQQKGHQQPLSPQQQQQLQQQQQQQRRKSKKDKDTCSIM